jgi:enoyl-CoA hydratase/carnithine racemase/predicted thioesterase
VPDGLDRGVKKGLQIGESGELELSVGAEHTITLGASEAGGGVSVFATPQMINLMEHAARETLKPFLEEGEESVGVSVSIKHLAATPLSAVVTARAEVLAVEGRQIDFSVTAHEGATKIGEGTHRRAIVSLEKMRASVTRPIPSSAPFDPAKLLFLKLEESASTLYVTLHRPEARNALHLPMTSELRTLLEWLPGQFPRLRVVVWQGAGGDFGSGEDIKELAGLKPAEAAAASLQRGRNVQKLAALPQVTVARIEGFCLGGALMLALACDFRMASHDAQLGLPEASLGWPPAYGFDLLTALLPRTAAFRLSLFNERLSACEARDLGLVDELAAKNLLAGKIHDLLSRVAQIPAEAQAATKKRLLERFRGLTDSALLQADIEAYRECVNTPAAKANLQGFVAKKT